MSGTTAQGNWLFRVADSIRRDGLVDEAEWPTPPNFTWEEYYQHPPIESVDKGRLFLREWAVQYEWVDITPESLEKHLKHAPLQVTIPGHAVVNFFRNEDIQRYFDSYDPFIKERTEPFLSAMKIVLSRKGMSEKEVRQLQALEGYKDESGVAFWTGKGISEYLAARLPDKVKTINESL